MHAAVLEEFDATLVVGEAERPEPGPGAALVDVRAVGLCGTDMKIMGGKIPSVRLPLVPGHEVAGVLAADAGDLRAGTPVACFILETCGGCRACAAGRPTVCANVSRLGFERGGGLAQTISVPASTLVPIPDGVGFAEAAVSMDAVLSPWHALVGRARLVAGESVAVIGAGGLGLHAVQIAVAHGARTCVIEPDEARRALAAEFGAETFAPGRTGDVLDWSGGGCDVSFEVSGTEGGFGAAVDLLTPGGRLVACGYQPGSRWGLDSSRFVLDELTLVGARGGTIEEAAEVLQAVASGKVRPVIAARFPLEEVNAALDVVRAQSSPGRVVIEMV